MKVELNYYCVVDAETGKRIAVSCRPDFRSVISIDKLSKNKDSRINLYDSVAAANKAKTYYSTQHFEKEEFIVKKVKVTYEIED